MKGRATLGAFWPCQERIFLGRGCCLRNPHFCPRVIKRQALRLQNGSDWSKTAADLARGHLKLEPNSRLWRYSEAQQSEQQQPWFFGLLSRGRRGKIKAAKFLAKNLFWSSCVKARICSEWDRRLRARKSSTLRDLV